MDNEQPDSPCLGPTICGAAYRLRRALDRAFLPVLLEAHNGLSINSLRLQRKAGGEKLRSFTFRSPAEVMTTELSQTSLSAVPIQAQKYA
jgi:hypothetical protein